MIPSEIVLADPTATGKIPGVLSSTGERPTATMIEEIMYTTIVKDIVLTETPEGGIPRQWTETVTEIPLGLVPRIIAFQIKKHGSTVYRIIATKMHGINYDVSVIIRKRKSGSTGHAGDQKKPPVILTGDRLQPVRRGE